MVLNYIGSKKSLLPFLENTISKLGIEGSSFCDPFSGTSSVGNYFKNDYTITSNDKEYYSYIISWGYMISNYSDKLERIINDLNNIKPKVGLITKNYSPYKECERMFFTITNAKKIDAIREEIERMKNESLINKDEYIFLLASLLESSDNVANIACVYGAYLKKYKKSALIPIILFPLHHTRTNKNNTVYNMDIQELFEKDIEYDIVYLDPPYNTRQYSTNYFVLNYLAKYEDIELKGKTGMPLYCYKSPFASKVKAKKAFIKLIETIKSKYIFLSYNNEGILSSKDIKKILETRGKVTLHTREYKRFKSQKNIKELKQQKTVTEYLYEVRTF